jgi:hypothetical protein
VGRVAAIAAAAATAAAADRGNNDQEDFAGHVARVVGRGAEFAMTIPQKVGPGDERMWDANGKVDMIAGILRYHKIH